MSIAKYLGILGVGLLLAGCAELKQLSDGSDAPVEERGVPSGAAAGAAGAAGQAPGTAATGQGTTGMVETHALPASGMGEQSGMGEASPSRPVPPVVGVSPEKAAMLVDPNNLLSKRVIYFDFDSDAIREEFRPLIERHAAFLRENDGARIILQGHTDERGSRDYNLALGQRRSESVKQALTLMGVGQMQVETVSLGEEKPIQEGHDESAWQLNRRAEIHYLGE